MSPNSFLTGESVRLDPMEESDLEFARDLINDPDVRWGLQASRPHSMADEREWYESLSDGDSVFVIRAEDDRVGVVALHEEERAPWGLAEVGYYVAPDHWGNGYATDAVRQVLRYGFEERRLNKAVADVYEGNEASASVLEKVGFEREGVRRDHAFVDGEFVDLWEYGLLEAEWRD